MGRKEEKEMQGVGEERRYLKKVRRSIGRLCINPCRPPLRNLNFFSFSFFLLAFLARGARVQLGPYLVAPLVGKTLTLTSGLVSSSIPQC